MCVCVCVCTCAPWEKVGMARTEEVSDVLLELADLVRGEIPDVAWRLATEAEIAEGDLGARGWLGVVRAVRAVVMGCGVRPCSVCGGRIVSRGVVEVRECVRGHDGLG